MNNTNHYPLVDDLHLQIALRTDLKGTRYDIEIGLVKLDDIGYQKTFTGQMFAERLNLGAMTQPQGSSFECFEHWGYDLACPAQPLPDTWHGGDPTQHAIEYLRDIALDHLDMRWNCSAPPFDGDSLWGMENRSVIKSRIEEIFARWVRTLATYPVDAEDFYLPPKD